MKNPFNWNLRFIMQFLVDKQNKKQKVIAVSRRIRCPFAFGLQANSRNIGRNKCRKMPEPGSEKKY